MSDGIAMYGGPPPLGPRTPDDKAWPWTPPVLPQVVPAEARPILPVHPPLVPCAACKRHIVAGTDCPFCHASELVEASKPIDRKALEAARLTLLAAYNDLARTTDAVRGALNAVEAALAKAPK